MVASGPSVLNINRSSCIVSSGLQKRGRLSKMPAVQEALATALLRRYSPYMRSRNISKAVESCGMCTGG